MVKPRYIDILSIEIDNEEVTNEHIEDYLTKHNITKYEELSGGRLNRVILVDDQVMKFSSGTYRKLELEREANILHELKKQDYIPEIHDFTSEKLYSVIVESFVKGDSLRQLLSSGVDRNKLWRQAGELLSKVHEIEANEENWLEGQLELAKSNYEKKLVDIEDFDDENPEEVLRWLIKNKPENQNEVLLHGDFRTKNIIVSESGMKLIDWGFVDIGSPYYDLAVFDYYFKSDEDRQSFYKGYKRLAYDKDLIEYYERLSRYINI